MSLSTTYFLRETTFSASEEILSHTLLTKLQIFLKSQTYLLESLTISSDRK